VRNLLIKVEYFDASAINFRLIYFAARLNGVIFDGTFGINGGF
jgi:hypothetical protein